MFLSGRRGAFTVRADERDIAMRQHTDGVEASGDGKMKIQRVRSVRQELITGANAAVRLGMDHYTIGGVCSFHVTLRT